MRRPEYLSPSSLKLWETNRREFYLRYLCERQVPKVPQTRPMAIGSAFDGLIKNKIEAMCGLPLRDYTGQVEAHNRVPGLGQDVMDAYLRLGGLKQICISGVPRMEFDIRGSVSGVPLRGKPDLYYKTAAGCRIIDDWKVNGYYSKASPQKGYIWDSKTQGAHKDQYPKKWLDVTVGACDLYHDEWKAQETTYGWLLGEPVGEEFVIRVHQMSYMNGEARLTLHSMIPDVAYQRSLRDRYVGCWEAITSGRCFTDMSAEADTAEQRHCDLIAQGLDDAAFLALIGGSR